MRQPELLVLFFLALLLFGSTRLSELSRQFAEAIENFRNNFRGGPPSPMHPVPSGDAALLRRRTKKTQS